MELIETEIGKFYCDITGKSSDNLNILSILSIPYAKAEREVRSLSL